MDNTALGILLAQAVGNYYDFNMYYYDKKEIKFRDPVVEHVVDKFVERSDIGFKSTNKH